MSVIVNNFIKSASLPFCSVDVIIKDNKKHYKAPITGWNELTFKECLNNNYLDESKDAIFIDVSGRFVVLDGDSEEACDYIENKLLKPYGLLTKEYKESSITSGVSEILKLKPKSKHYYIKVFSHPRKLELKDKTNFKIDKLDIRATIIAEHKNTENLYINDIPNISNELMDLLIGEKQEEKQEENKEEQKEIKLKDEEEAIKKLLNILDDKYYTDFEEWRNVGFIIKSINEDYEYLFEEFSKKNLKKYEPKEFKRFWRSIKSKDYGNKLTLATLLYYAKESNEDKYNKWVSKYLIIEKEEKKIENNKTYEAVKKEVEKQFFKLNDPSLYVRVYDGELQFKSDKEANHILQNKFYEEISEDKKGNNKIIKKDFYKTWVKDENIKTYEKIVFDPSNNQRETEYNIFDGFINDDITVEAECIPEFDKLIKFIFKTETNIKFFYSWLNHIINKPHIKTEKSIVLYSEKGGVGKNSIIDLIIKLFGMKYTSKLSNIGDFTKQFNSHLSNKLLVFGDEIESKAHAISDTLKNVITQKEINIEKKGKDIVTINDYANYIFTTNNETAFRVDEGDRRYFLIEITDKLEKSFYDSYHKSLNDEIKIKKFFKYIKNYNNPVEIIGIPPPMTDYKLRIISNFSPSYIQYFYRLPHLLANNQYLASELYEHIKEYGRKNYLTTSFTIKLFGDFIEELKIPKVRKSKGQYYKFPDINELLIILKKYNADYYENLNTSQYEPGQQEEEINYLDI